MSIPENQQSVFSKQVHPLKQVVICLIALIAVMGVAKLAFPMETLADRAAYWEIAFAILMGYALFNSIFSLSYHDKTVYFRDSILCFIGLAAAGGFLAWYFSGLTMDEAGSFRWLYFVFGFSYLVFISIVNLMRKIIEIAKKQDARLRGEQ